MNTPLPLPLSIDDRFRIEQLQTERFRFHFYETLRGCILFWRAEELIIVVDREDENFNQESLQKIDSELEELKLYAWLITGALRLVVKLRENPIYSLEIQQNSTINPIQALLWDLQFEEILTFEVPMPSLLTPETETTNGTIPATSDALLESVVDGIVQNIPESRIQQLLVSKLTERIQPMADRMLTPSDAPVEAATPASSNGTTVVAPAAQKEKVSRKPKAARAAGTAESDVLTGLKISLSSFDKTIENVLEKMAPGNQKKQVKIAKGVIENSRSYRWVIPAIVELFVEKGKEKEKSTVGLMKSFKKIVDRQEVLQAPSEEAPTS